MRPTRWLTIIGLLAMSAALPGAAFAQASQANPAWGRVLAERNRCMQCHGVDGYAVEAEAPNLAGQREDYIIRQLNHYRGGSREHPFMELFAGNLSESDMADIAAYFSCQGERKRDTDRCRRER